MVQLLDSTGIFRKGGNANHGAITGIFRIQKGKILTYIRTNKLFRLLI